MGTASREEERIRPRLWGVPLGACSGLEERKCDCGGAVATEVVVCGEGECEEGWGWGPYFTGIGVD